MGVTQLQRTCVTTWPQAAWRGCAARRRLARAAAAAAAIQAAWRERLARRQWAAVQIQRRVRGAAARAVLRRRLLAAVTIQVRGDCTQVFFVAWFVWEDMHTLGGSCCALFADAIVLRARKEKQYTR